MRQPISGGGVAALPVIGNTGSLRSTFIIEFVQNRKLFPWRVGSTIRTLYGSRIDADYKPRRVALEQQASERLRQAKEIVEQIAGVM